MPTRRIGVLGPRAEDDLMDELIDAESGVAVGFDCDSAAI